MGVADLTTLQSEFATRGYAVLRAVVPTDTLEAVRGEMRGLVDEAASRMLASGRVAHTFDDEPFETRLARLYEGEMDQAPKLFRSELHRPGLYGLFFLPQLLDVVSLILGPEVRLYPNYSARPKLPDWEGTLVLWHQDGGYTEGEGVAGLRMVNVWTPLVHADVQNGCMEFVPGTHRLGAVRHIARKHYLEIDPDVIAPWLDRTVPIELDPGDIVLFDNMLFHRGLPNRARTIRWSLDWRYQDATQPTMRTQSGHLARSVAHPEDVVRGADDWARRRLT